MRRQAEARKGPSLPLFFRPGDPRGCVWRSRSRRARELSIRAVVGANRYRRRLERARVSSGPWVSMTPSWPFCILKYRTSFQNRRYFSIQANVFYEDSFKFTTFARRRERKFLQLVRRSTNLSVCGAVCPHVPSLGVSSLDLKAAERRPPFFKRPSTVASVRFAVSVFARRTPWLGIGRRG